MTDDIDFSRPYSGCQTCRVFLCIFRTKTNGMLACDNNVQRGEGDIRYAESAVGIQNIGLRTIQNPNAEAFFFGIFQIQKVVFRGGARYGRGMIGYAEDFLSPALPPPWQGLSLCRLSNVRSQSYACVCRINGFIL